MNEKHRKNGNKKREKMKFLLHLVLFMFLDCLDVLLCYSFFLSLTLVYVHEFNLNSHDKEVRLWLLSFQVVKNFNIKLSFLFGLVFFISVMDESNNNV